MAFAPQSLLWSVFQLEDDKDSSAMDALKAKVAGMEDDERMRWYKAEKTKRESEEVCKRRTFTDPQHVQKHGTMQSTEDSEIDGFL